MRAACAAMLACAALAACSPEERDTARADHEAGRQIYNFRCYFCHGYSGDARTLAASMIEPAPRDFTRARDLDERRVLAALRQGIPGTAMASFDGTLSPREMEISLLICQGLRAEDIARRLSLSGKTVATHKYRLFDKLGIKDTVALARMAAQHGVTEASRIV